MASEIMADPTPTLKSDMQESSIGREPQGIMINQGSLSNLLECIKQMLQPISMVQTNPHELRKEDTQPTTVQIPLEVKEEFEACLLTSNCDELLKLVEKSDAELFLQVVDKKTSRTALHVAVLKGSRTLIGALAEKLKATPGGNDLKLVERDFIRREDEFGLSAPNMATLIANTQIISCFEQDLEVFNPLQCPTSEVKKTDMLIKAAPLLGKPAPTSSDQGTRQLTIEDWLRENDIDFVYCLHEAAMNKSPSQKKALQLVEHIFKKEDFSILKPLLLVRDSLGKSPLHVQNNPNFKPLFERLVKHFPDFDFNMTDFSGRTPLHWAAAQGDVDVVKFLVDKKDTNLNATYGTSCKEDMNVTPLHLAVIHNHAEVVKVLLNDKTRKGEGKGQGQELDVNAVCYGPLKILDGNPEHPFWTPIQLAAYMGHVRILKKFLKDPRVYDPGFIKKKESVPKNHNMIPALHLAASQFYPVATKTILINKKMDTFVKDKDKHTALHYAAMHAHGQLRAQASLFDYVTVSHFTSKPPQSRRPSDYDIITCFDLLMQSGLNMEERNEDAKNPAKLHPFCPEKVQSWWLQKMAQEAHEKKNNLVSAANAVLVTAALVATASFVGPLQPPLGLLDDGNTNWLEGYSQVKHTSIEVFLFCDSLSFYLAIAAIVFATLPSWSLPHEGLVQEVHIAQRCVQVAILLLFGSIIFVVCAFSAASIAIVPEKRWRYKTIAVISTILGVLICFLILFLSFMRLLALISSQNDFAKKLSRIATQIILWPESNTSIANEEVREEVTKSTG